MALASDTSMFVAFCIEQYKHAKSLSGDQAAEELKRYGVLDYLSEHYEVLHTQSHHWLLEEIDEFITKRKPLPQQ